MHGTTTPSSRQFVSLAADQSGEVICAGTLDSFEVHCLVLLNFDIPIPLLIAFLEFFYSLSCITDFCLVNEDGPFIGCSQWSRRSCSWVDVFSYKCELIFFFC